MLLWDSLFTLSEKDSSLNLMTLGSVGIQMIVLFVAIVLGYFARKAKIMSNSFDSRLSKLVLDITLPCMIIAAVLANDSLPDQQTVLSILLYSFVGYAVILVIAIVMPIVMRFKKADRGTYSFIMAFGNVGFLGFPVVSSLFGHDAILYVAVFNIPFNLLVFTIGVFLLSDPKKGFKERFLAGAKNVLSPTLAASVVAMVLALLRITDSGAIGQAFDVIGQMTTPAALLLIGSTLARYPILEMLTNVKAYIASAFRLIVMPIVMYFVFSNFVSDPLLLATMVLTVGMPVASNGTLLCLTYEGNLKAMLQGTFITTIFSIVTIPLLTVFIL